MPFCQDVGDASRLRSPVKLSAVSPQRVEFAYPPLFHPLGWINPANLSEAAEVSLSVYGMTC